MVKRNSYQRASSYNSDPSYLCGVGVTHAIRVKRLSPLTALTALRVIFTRIANGVKHSLSPEEVLLVDECAQSLSKVRDPQFLANHLVKLEMLSHCIKLTKLALKRKMRIDADEITAALTCKHDPSIKEKHYALIPLCEYFGNYSEWQASNLLIKENLLKRTSHPPKRYVGVGYRDKGSRKIPSTDASPAWQDVASSPIVYDKGRILDPGGLDLKTIRVKTLNAFK